MKLLYRTAEWHGLAKLRMHTESSLALLESLTTEFGLLMQNFQELTCSHFETIELPSESAARKRRELSDGTAGPSQVNIRQTSVLGHRAAEHAESITAPTPATSSDRKYSSHLSIHNSFYAY